MDKAAKTGDDQLLWVATRLAATQARIEAMKPIKPVSTPLMALLSRRSP